MKQTMGDLTQELENVIAKMAKKQKLQHGEILAAVAAYLEIHYPDAMEQYTDGTVPIRYYGHVSGLIKFAKGMENVTKIRKKK